MSVGAPAPGPPAPGPSSVVQVTNLSASVSSEQLRTLFGFLGTIEELRLYPPDHASPSFSSKVCYIRYLEPESVGVAQHLTNTVFLDRALIVVPCADGRIPEESKALSLLAPVAPPPSGLLPLPTQASPLQSLGLPLSSRVSSTLDSSSSSSSLPPLVGNVDPSKVDEIRRTVYVGNLNSQNTTADQLLEFFRQVGEVKFVRMAGDETQPTRFAFVEFVEQESVSRALSYNGVMFRDRPLKINHSNNAIVKPPELTAAAAAKELEVVMQRVREAQSSIAAVIQPETKKKKSSSSGSKRRHRSRSKSRTRSRSKSRSRSRSKTRRKRSRSRRRGSQRSSGGTSQGNRGNQRRRSRSRERRSSPSRSRTERRRSRDRSKSPRKKPRSPSPRRGRREKRRERRERSSSRKRSHREEERRRSRAPLMKEDRERAESATPTEEGNSSPNTMQHNGSYTILSQEDDDEEEEQEEEEEEEDLDSNQ